MPAFIINVRLGLASAEFMASSSISDCLTIHWVVSLRMTVPKATNSCVRGQRSPLFMALESLFHSLRARQSCNLRLKHCSPRLPSAEYIFQIVDIYHSVALKSEIAAEGIAKEPSQSPGTR